MGTQLPEELPRSLASLRGKFDKWRQQRPKGERIPEPLWNQALKMALIHGRNRTAKVLRLNYDDLKKRLSAMESKPTSSAFIELQPGIFPSVSMECTVEWGYDGDSAVRMRIQGMGLHELTSLAGILREESK